MASGVVSTARLTGQTIGGVMVAVIFALTYGDIAAGVGVALTVGALCAGFACVISFLRLTQGAVVLIQAAQRLTTICEGLVGRPRAKSIRYHRPLTQPMGHVKGCWYKSRGMALALIVATGHAAGGSRGRGETFIYYLYVYIDAT